MKKNCFAHFYPASLLFVVLFLFSFQHLTAQTSAAVSIDNLEVEYSTTPLGIDVQQPRFSWQMQASGGVRGMAQSQYQLIVADPEGKIVWDSGKVGNAQSIDIVYNGSALKPSTRYQWTANVWDKKGTLISNKSWFETGLMNPDPNLSAWDGAQWIGGGDKDLVLYAQYLPLFDLKYNLTILPGSNKAAIVFAANDERLMSKNRNIFQTERKKNESYFKVELDISGLEQPNGNAKINVYRAGYVSTDTATKPVKTFIIKTDVIGSANKNSAHHFTIHNEYGTLTLSVDDNPEFFPPGSIPTPPAGFFGPAKPSATVTLNPLGPGHDVISYGMLCDIGFSVDAGQQASFSDLAVVNIRKPANTIFREDLSKPGYDGIFKAFKNSGLTIKDNSYFIYGGDKGVFFVADPTRNAMPMLRTVFDATDKKVEKARLYVTARGIYEMYLNGKRIGDDYFNPGLTQYNITHFYQTYDVTDAVTNGKNALGAMLGEGWWSGLLSYGAIWNHFGDRQSLLAKLEIVYTDGTKKIITTNGRDWKYFNAGPVVYASLDMGEVYDANRESAINGWSTNAYNDEDWSSAVTVPLAGTTYSGTTTDFMGNKQSFDYDKLQLIGQIGQNAGVYKTLTATSVSEVRKGVYVYNLGQNIVGVPKITIKNGASGKNLVIRYGEILYPNLKESANNVGMIMTENYRAALNQDVYVMKDGAQIFEPHLTSHGFQYLEITGIDQPLPLEDVQALAISSIRKLTANYETSNKKVNKLWSNLTWSNIDNFLTIPTDCPQRNERMGWSGDISVFSRTATYLSNSDQFLRRHMFAMRDLQTAKGKFTDIAPIGGGFGGLLWGSAGIIVPWEVYQQYNDTGLLQEHYEAMKRYMTYVDSTINKKTGLSTDNVLGDWLGPQYNQLGTDFLVTAYHIYDLNIMRQVAELLHKPDDAKLFAERYSERKSFFNKTFVNADKKTIGLIGGGPFGPRNVTPEFKVADTQTSYAVALALGAFSDENIPFMVKNLKAAVSRENKGDDGVVRPPYSLMTGFIGTSWISKTLSDYGMPDLSYQILQNEKYPSWLYPINQGATTIWERLNGYTVENGFGGNNSMNSFNHYSFGAIGQWMIAYSLGIQRDGPGFSKFILQPEPDPTGQMTWAKGHYDSAYGRINSEWTLQKGQLEYKATVPPNTTATLVLPASSSASIREGGKPLQKSSYISLIKYENGKAWLSLKPGVYVFTAGM